MNKAEAKILLSKIRFAMNDRYANKVSEAINMDVRTVYKIVGGDENIRPSIIRRLCNYLDIDIPKDTIGKDQHNEEETNR